MNNTKLVLSLLIALVSACAPAARPPVPVPTPSPQPLPDMSASPPLAPTNPSLPAIPLATGPLAINVVYPKAGTLVATRDSNFIFGSLGNGTARLWINGVPVPVWPNGSFMGFIPVPPQSQPSYELVAAAGTEVSRVTVPVRLLPPRDTVRPLPADTAVTVQPSPDPVYGILVGPATVANDTDRVVTAQPVPDPHLQRYFLFPGTVVRVTSAGASETMIQIEGIRLSVPNSQITPQQPGYTPPPLVLGPDTLVRDRESVDLVVSVSAPPVFYVQEGDHQITLTFFEVSPSPAQRSRVTTIADAHVREVRETHIGGKSEYTFILANPPFGYQRIVENGKFIFKVRRPPVIDPAAPLRGLIIAVDPGHPPAGATGPTALYEGDAVVPVALRLRDLLQQRGATVMMTKTTPDTLELNIRPTMARRAGAHALVSIHYNALPDGVNPFLNNGSSTYYFHAHSARLAQVTEAAIVRNMFLRDLGALRANFALVRQPWMPAILTEGAFIMMPDQEHAIKTPEYQDAYARSIVEGMEEYFRGLAKPSTP